MKKNSTRSLVFPLNILLQEGAQPAEPRYELSQMHVHSLYGLGIYVRKKLQ